MALKFWFKLQMCLCEWLIEISKNDTINADESDKMYIFTYLVQKYLKTFRLGNTDVQRHIYKYKVN